MLSWSLPPFLVVIVAAVFGFGSIAPEAAEIARVCFFLFFVVFALTLIWHLAAALGAPAAGRLRRRAAWPLRRRRMATR